MSLTITKFIAKGLDTLIQGEPVAILLHGYGADERDLPDLMSSLPQLPWVSLRAPVSLENEGFAWYPISQSLKPLESDVRHVTESVWNWIDDYLPEDSDLILIGFSQGALMATQLLRSRPERIKATVILAGFMFDGAMPGDESLLKTKPKVIYCRGLNDQLIPKEAIANLNSWLQTHTKSATKTYPGLGHSIDQRVIDDVSVYLAGQLGKSS